MTVLARRVLAAWRTWWRNRAVIATPPHAHYCAVGDHYWRCRAARCIRHQATPCATHAAKRPRRVETQIR